MSQTYTTQPSYTGTQYQAPGTSSYSYQTGATPSGNVGAGPNVYGTTGGPYIGSTTYSGPNITTTAPQGGAYQAAYTTGAYTTPSIKDVNYRAAQSGYGFNNNFESTNAYKSPNTLSTREAENPIRQSQNFLSKSNVRQSLLDPYRKSTYKEFEQVEDLPDRSNLINSINISLQESPSKESLLISPNRVSIIRQSTLSPAKIEIQSLLKEKDEDGTVYEGEAQGEVKHGKGKLTWKDGRKFVGQFNNGRAEGKGVFHFKSGKVCYEGEVNNLVYEGHGVLQCELPTPLQGAVDFKNLSEIGNNWIRYEGSFKNGKKHGNGTIYFTNGEKFVGNFEHDVAEGKGAFSTRDGRNVEGVWKNNLLQ